VTGDHHAGICGRPGVKFPRATRPVRAGSSWRDLHDVDVLGGEHRVEWGGVFGVSVATEESKPGDPVLEVHQEIAGGLGGPGRGGMRGDAEDVDSSGADLHHEQHVEPVQADGVEGTGRPLARCP
jgi:hypothetical protein